MELIQKEFIQSQNLLNAFIANDQNFKNIALAAQLMCASILGGGKILSCGNGGSMCDAMHFAEELSGRYRTDRRALPALAIADASHLSCVANDYGYQFVFSRYIEALGNENDVLLAISTSGNSQNVLLAAQAAQKKGLKIVALTGNSGGELAQHCDVEIRVPHTGFADRIQEIHIKIIHSLILSIEQQLFGNA